jgi:hypothetical protein
MIRYLVVLGLFLNVICAFVLVDETDLDLLPSKLTTKLVRSEEQPLNLIADEPGMSFDDGLYVEKTKRPKRSPGNPQIGAEEFDEHVVQKNHGPKKRRGKRAEDEVERFTYVKSKSKPHKRQVSPQVEILPVHDKHVILSKLISQTRRRRSEDEVERFTYVKPKSNRLKRTAVSKVIAEMYYDRLTEQLRRRGEGEQKQAEFEQLIDSNMHPRPAPLIGEYPNGLNLQNA